jgi:uncharacterized protein YkwD
MTRLVPPFLALLAATAFSVAGPAAPRADAGARLSGSERKMIRLVNDVRVEHGLGTLQASRPLGRAADSHSRDMLRHDFFDHTSSDGTPFDRRVRRYTDARELGETLAAHSRRRGGAALIVRMWMESPGHRAVLLTPGFRRIGIARRWGVLGGAEQAVVTADFASRR